MADTLQSDSSIIVMMERVAKRLMLQTVTVAQ